jgi:ADP-ribosylglycohydrolase
MLGAIIGDICGSIYEFRNHKAKDCILFHPDSFPTDDSILTIALAYSVLKGRPPAEALRDYGRRYDASYGGGFRAWLEDPDMGPYNSYGNGAAMRVSAAAWARDTEQGVLDLARDFCLPTHDHPEGIKGGQAVALAIFLARTGASKADIKDRIEAFAHYDLSRTCDQIRPGYQFDVTCQGTVPQALCAFLEATDFADAIRCAISLGGDSDTIGAITGAVAEAFFGVPDEMGRMALALLDADLAAVTVAFRKRWVQPRFQSPFGAPPSQPC